MAKRRPLLRADVTRSLADEPLPEGAADHRLRAKAGVYNVHPQGFLLGILGALFAILFAWYAAEREGARQNAPTAPLPLPEREIDVELE